MDLIRIEDNNFVLDAEASKSLKNFELAIKEIKKSQDYYKQQILEEMKSKGIIKIETDDLTITFVDETDRETLDSKAIKQELPDIYDTYTKFTKVKPSIRIKLK